MNGKVPIEQKYCLYIKKIQPKILEINIETIKIQNLKFVLIKTINEFLKI